MYDFSEDGVERDIYKAIEWYAAAAKQGNRDAQYNLAVIYDEGEGVAVDDAKAVYWYQLAAMSGEHNAQTNLSVMYFNGEGIETDVVEGLAWAYISAASASELAISNLQDFEEAATNKQQRRAKRRAGELLASMNR